MKNGNSIIFRFLKFVEKVSDKLPNPFFLFLILVLFTIILSVIASLLGFSALHPVTDELIEVKKHNIQGRHKRDVYLNGK